MAPFEGETHLETYSMHLNENPPKIVEPVLPDELQKLLDKCLSKDPSGRPESMSALAQELQSLPTRKGAEIESSGPQQVVVDTRKSSPRLFVLVAIAIGIIVVTIGCLALFYQLSQRPTAAIVPKPLDLERDFRKSPWIETKTDLDGACWTATPSTTDADIDELLAKKTQFVSLRLSQITNAGLDRMTKMPLTMLDLNNTRFDDTAAPIVAKFHNLVYLSLANSKFTNKGIKNLARLHKLQRLDLDTLTDVNDQGLDYVIKQWPNIQHLNLSRTSISQAGLMRLNELPRLRILELADTEISDRVMAELVKRHSLRELNLNAARFDPKWLKELPGMSGLRVLLISKVAGVKPAQYAVLEKTFGNRCRVLCFDNLGNKINEATPMIDFIGADGVD